MKIKYNRIPSRNLRWEHLVRSEDPQVGISPKWAFNDCPIAISKAGSWLRTAERDLPTSRTRLIKSRNTLRCGGPVQQGRPRDQYRFIQDSPSVRAIYTLILVRIGSYLHSSLCLSLRESIRLNNPEGCDGLLRFTRKLVDTNTCPDRFHLLESLGYQLGNFIFTFKFTDYVYIYISVYV